MSADDLLRACLDTQDELAWAEFVRRFQKLIATVALRTARHWGEGSIQTVDELVQETYLKLCADNCRLLRSFSSIHENSVYGFIKVVTTNLVHDYFKASRSQKRGGPTAAVAIDHEESRLTLRIQDSGAAESDRRLLIWQVDSCLQTVVLGPHADRDRRIFWLHYRVGLTAAAIAGLPSIRMSSKGVESTLLRLTRQLRQRLGTCTQADSLPAKLEKGIQAADSF
jgi:RNA polymerase sigma-70 factor (ECF subfamily)